MHLSPSLPPRPLLQLFLEQNEEEAEKMEAKEEKQREIEKSQIKVRRRACGQAGVGWVVPLAGSGSCWASAGAVDQATAVVSAPGRQCTGHVQHACRQTAVPHALAVAS